MVLNGGDVGEAHPIGAFWSSRSEPWAAGQRSDQACG